MPQLPQQFLGKRKGRSDEELADDSPSRINPLTPVSDDSGLTVEVAMDCEMVGVDQGNKSALGRVTLQRIFELFRKKVAELIKGRDLVGHALRNDLKALLLSHPKDIRDALEYVPFMRIDLWICPCFVELSYTCDATEVVSSVT